MRAFFEQSIMKTKLQKISLALIFACAITSANAQTDIDAFRYSTTNISGTSRFTSMSGAFGALGGDFSVLSTNPAGIGIFRSNEISFTPSIFAGSTTSSFQGNVESDTKYNFNFGHAGLIFSEKIGKQDDSPGWKNWNFGFGYNRINNFHNRSIYEGKNDNNTMLDYFAQQSQGKSYENLDPFYEYMAYYTYLINPDSTNQYTPAFTPFGQTQRRSVESRGAVGEMVFTFGGNYSNKLYLGATLGIETLRYTEESTYEELDAENGIDTLKSYRFTQNLTTDGNGINLKLGLIYRPNDIFRLGLAFHTPTWYTMKDLYKNNMRSEFDGGSVYTKESPDGEFNYELMTPFKAIGSMAFIFGQYGVLDADYEFSDYSESRFHASDYGFLETNSTITHKYTGVHTIRVGTEWRYENLSFRGGVNYSTSPLMESYKVTGNDFSKKGFSLGIGMRDEHFFLDLGYLHSISNQFYQPYTLVNQDVAGVKSDVVTNNFTVTLGVKF